MPHKLAIDFGTTNTVVAHWNAVDSTPEIVALPGLSTTQGDHPALVPSLVYLHDGQVGQVTIAQAVRDQQLDCQPDNRLFRNFKRGMVASPAPAPRQIDGALWADRDAGQIFLRALINALPYPSADIDQLVLTAPVASFESYLSWLNRAVDQLGAENLYIVDESTAAALGYAVTEPGAVVLVVDFGGGTLDLSLVQLPENRETTGGVLRRLLGGNAHRHTARVVAKAGRVLGGSDIDQWLLLEVLKRTNRSPETLGNGYAALLTACEQAKISLSTAESTALTFEAGGQSPSVTLTRAELERLLEERGFYTALRYAIDKVMHVAHRTGIYKEDINAVLMVGGVSLMPSVQAMLRGYFSAAMVRADKPFTAVAEGALQVAAGFGLDDYLAHSYGIRHIDPDTGEPRYDEIIAMGSRYPSDKPVEVILGAAHPDQESVEFVIGEIGGDAAALVEVRYREGQTVFVAQTEGDQQTIVPLNECEARETRADLNPVGNPGEDRLKASFVVDDQRRLRLTVTDLKTRKTLLKDVVIAHLQARDTGENRADQRITGHEPRLADGAVQWGQRRLSLRNIAAMLSVLPPDAISPEAAAAALNSASFQARYSAAKALSRRADRDARRVMQEVLTNGNTPARASAARHLYGFSWFTAEPLVRLALADSDSRVREAVMYALCDFRELRAYQLMAQALEDEEDNVCEAAAYGLRDCQDPAAVPVLAAALRAIDPDVRVRALEALSANDTPQAVPVVRAALGDADPDVQYAAVASLLELIGVQALDELADLIEQARGRSRQRILAGFFHATNYLNINNAKQQAADRLLDALEAALHDDLPGVRIAAIYPLAWMRHPRAASLLTGAYDRESDSSAKAEIVRVAAGLMSTVGEAILQDALASSDPAVRQAADQIMLERERAGGALTYDETAQAGTGLMKPSVGR